MTEKEKTNLSMIESIKNAGFGFLQAKTPNGQLFLFDLDTLKYDKTSKYGVNLFITGYNNNKSSRMGLVSLAIDLLEDIQWIKQ